MSYYYQAYFLVEMWKISSDSGVYGAGMKKHWPISFIERTEYLNGENTIGNQQKPNKSDE